MKTPWCALISDRKTKQTPGKKAGDDQGRNWSEEAAGRLSNGEARRRF